MRPFTSLFLTDVGLDKSGWRWRVGPARAWDRFRRTFGGRTENSRRVASGSVCRTDSAIGLSSVGLHPGRLGLSKNSRFRPSMAAARRRHAYIPPGNAGLTGTSGLSRIPAQANIEKGTTHQVAETSRAVRRQ